MEILQTPVLEAFTNNIASLKSKLLTLTNNNLLYLPIIKLNTEVAGYQPTDSTVGTGIASGTHAVFVDQGTVDAYKTNVTNYVDGINGPAFDGSTQKFRLDQGLDTNEISAVFNLDAELTENQYIVEVDNRFGAIVDIEGNTVNPSYIDDDNVASYYLSTGPFVTNLEPNKSDGSTTKSSIQGPRGTKLRFSILSSVSLRTSTFLFDQVGSSDSFTTTSPTAGDVAFKFIDSTIRVQGATTGYRVDIPVRFIKKS